MRGRRAVDVAAVVLLAFAGIACPVRGAKPFVVSLLSGFCNVTDAHLTLDFDRGALDAAIASPTGAALAAISTGVALDDPSATLLVLDSGCNALAAIPRSGLPDVRLGMRPADSANASIAAGAAPRTEVGGAMDGVGNATRFNHPTAMVATSRGEFLVADVMNHVIRRVRYRPDGQSEVATVAGNIFAEGDADGPATLIARFRRPSGMASDARLPRPRVYVADTNNGLLRAFTYDVVQESAQDITTAAGLRGVRIVRDGLVGTAALQAPGGVVVTAVPSARHMVYFTEVIAGVVRRLNVDGGVVATLSGVWNTSLAATSVGRGFLTGAAEARFLQPLGLSLRGAANAADEPLFVTDRGLGAVGRLTMVEAVDATSIWFAGKPGIRGVVDGGLPAARLDDLFSTRFFAARNTPTPNGTDIFDVAALWVMAGPTVRAVINADDVPLPPPTETITSSPSLLPTRTTTATATGTATTTATSSFSRTTTDDDDTRTDTAVETATASLVPSDSATLLPPTDTVSVSETDTFVPEPNPPRIIPLDAAGERLLRRELPHASALAFNSLSEVLPIVAGFTGFPTLPIVAARSRALLVLAQCPVDEGAEYTPSRGVHWLRSIAFSASEFSQMLVVTLAEVVLILAAVLVFVLAGRRTTFGESHSEQSEAAARVVSLVCVGVFAAWSVPALQNTVTITTRTYFDSERVVSASAGVLLLVGGACLLWTTASPSNFHRIIVCVTTVQLPEALRRELVSRDDIPAEAKASVLRAAEAGQVPGARVRLRWRDRHSDTMHAAYWHALLARCRDPRDWLSRNLVAIEIAFAAAVSLCAAPFPGPAHCEASLIPAAIVLAAQMLVTIVGRPYRGLRYGASVALMLAVDSLSLVAGFVVFYHESPAEDDWDRNALLVSVGFLHFGGLVGLSLLQLFATLRTQFFVLRDHPVWRTKAAANDERAIISAADSEAPITGRDVPLAAGAPADPLYVPPTLTGAWPAMAPHDASRLIATCHTGEDAAALLKLPDLYAHVPRNPLHTAGPLHDRVLDITSGYDHRVQPAGVKQDERPVPLLSMLHTRRRLEEDFPTGDPNLRL